MRQTGDSLICAYDNNKLLALNNVHVGNLINSAFSLKFITALINSNLLNFYYKSLSLETGRAMAQTDIETIEDLPIKKASLDNQKTINIIVDKIQDLTLNDDYLTNQVKQNQVNEYKNEVDQLVYKLYNLSEEEINLIENNS